MRNVRMLIEYDGTNFCGWQYQPNQRTVQGEIENALKRLTGNDVRITGAGRTDQGVHALGQVANFHTTSNLELRQIHNGVNSLTGDDVYIKMVCSAEDDFHSRYSAKAKVYRYHIISEPSPFSLRYNWFVKQRLDKEKIEQAKECLLGEHDFKNFSVGNGKSNTDCAIYNISLTGDDTHIIIEMEGNRFLRKMVRGIVGFMYDVGRGFFSPGQTQDLLDGKIGEIYFAPPHGLFLLQVEY